ncbi:MAG TPA: hypothetical protein VFL65_00715 [Jatrophihabitans sp.]|nr:hypothetical protein [Jatrophihabitans sp.]
MSDDVDPFAEPPGPPRDRYGRPLIAPAKRDGTPNTKAKPVPYTRASTFCGYPADKSGLTAWKLRHAVVGVAISPDLAGMAGALGRNPDDLDRQGKADLDAIIETAHDRSGGNAKANYGTAVHSLTEPGNTGHVPDRMAADVDAYAAAMDAAGLSVVDTERFTVNDDLRVAGTYDHRVETCRQIVATVDGEAVTIEPGVRMLLDKKTGSLHFDEHAIQLATYARGKLYDPDTWQREPLDVSPQWGVLAHVPAGQGKAALYLVDLHAGWKGAKIAAEVRDWRSGARKLAGLFAEHDGGPVEPTPAATVAPGGIVEPAAPVAESDGVELVAPAAAVDEGPALEMLNPEAPVKVDAEAAALALLQDKLGARPLPPDPILSAILAAKDGDACKALWSANRREWTEEHTEAVKAWLAALQAAA